jgi:hypothetical protein
MNEIKMNIPHAADARRAIEKGQYEKAVKQAAEVEALITKAVSQGQTSAGGSGRLEAPVKAKLEEMGYKCSSGCQYNEDYWSVSWQNGKSAGTTPEKSA